jgi:predicted enzyme related to lactoylglutathione lyase
MSPGTSSIDVQVNIDCADKEALRAFYCAALGYVPHAEAGVYATCVPAAGAIGPKIVFQQVPEPKRGKNRMHFDLIVADIEAEAVRFAALGATRVSEQPVRENGCQWIVMLDPEGNELCLCDS